MAVLQAPHQRAVARGMPTAELPSDHISLVADFIVSAGAGTVPSVAPDHASEPIIVE